MDIEVRPLAVSDIPAVCETQAGAYQDSYVHEPPETFAAYLRAFPAGSFAAVANDSLVGYAVGHPWLKGVPPPLWYIGVEPMKKPGKSMRLIEGGE